MPDAYLYEHRLTEEQEKSSLAELLRDRDATVSAAAAGEFASEGYLVRPLYLTLEPLWIVNDLGELGVKIGDRFFFLYKGDNIEYGDRRTKEGYAAYEDGTPMMWRRVGKREFGETCQPREIFRRKWPTAKYHEPLIFDPVLSFGKPEDCEWKPLPAPRKSK